MVLINEFLPNPSGSDADGEWVELFNGGSESVNLAGWTLATKGGKKFSLGGKTIDAGDYLLLPRVETKLTLHNTDGALALYDASGKLADEAQFFGTAPEGKSFVRDEGGLRFTFTNPTPGAENIFPQAELALVAQNVPIGQALNPQVGSAGIWGMAVGAGLVLAGLVMVIVLQNENLKKLFFSGDPEIR